jgi:hypothetical protein
MSLRQRKGFKAIAVFLAFAFAQVYVQTSFAGPGATRVSMPLPQRFVARLTIRGGPSATVNGASASSGATVLTGATIETPDQVSATLDLGPLGTVELQPNSAIQIDFSDDGNVRVKVLRGCVAIKKRGPGEAEAYTAEGASEKTNNKRKAMGFCYAQGNLNPLSSVGAATAAGGGGGGLFGLGTAATVAILGGGGAIVVIAIIATHGSNPSP